MNLKVNPGALERFAVKAPLSPTPFGALGEVTSESRKQHQTAERRTAESRKAVTKQIIKNGLESR